MILVDLGELLMLQQDIVDENGETHKVIELDDILRILYDKEDNK